MILEPHKNKVSQCFHCFPIYLPWSDGTRCHDLHFLMLSFKPTFSLSSFTFIKRLLSSSSLSAIRVMPSAYLRLLIFLPVQISSVQYLSHVQLCATPWTAARQASLSITNSWSLLKLVSIELVMLSNHLILCHPLLLLRSIVPSIRVFSNESVLRIRWSKY